MGKTFFVRNFALRLFSSMLLLMVCTMTVCAAEEWEYGKHYRLFYYSGGKGTKSDPYLIGNAQDLADLAYRVTDVNDDLTGVYFKQIADIVLNDISYGADGKPTNVSQLQPWTPIGEFNRIWDDDFQGIYDGNGHSISGLYIKAQFYYNGLFGSCEDAIIKNLTLKNVYLEGSKYDNKDYDGYNVYSSWILGCVVGKAKSSTFTNVRVENALMEIAHKNYTPMLGGLIGNIEGSGNLKDCSFTGNITVNLSFNDNIYIGGLAGYIDEIHMTNCYTGKGKIYINDDLAKGKEGESDNYKYEVGGFIGHYEEPNSSSPKMVEECTNNIDIETKINYLTAYIRAFSFSAEMPYLKYCTNFGSIKFYQDYGIVGLTHRFIKAEHCASYGKYEVGDNVLINLLGWRRSRYSSYYGWIYEEQKDFAEHTFTDFVNGSSSDIFVCPIGGLPGNETMGYKQVSVEYLKNHAWQIVERMNKNEGRVVWGIAKSQGNAPYDITGCPMPIASGISVDNFLGSGTEEDPYLIGSADDLQHLQHEIANNSSDMADKYYKMTADIDMTGTAPMEAIGTDNTPFTGTFDGNGYVISNLTENGPALFGYLDGTVKNLGIVNVNFVNSENRQCAGIAYQTAKNKAATITDCYVGGNLSITLPQVIAKDLSLSGLISKFSPNGSATTTIKNCYFKGVMSISETSADEYGFGLVGDENNKYSSSLKCSDCYASFSFVKSSKSKTCGVAGLMPGQIQTKDNATNCHYVCKDNNYLAYSKGLDSDAELAQYFKGKDGWLEGAWRPVLKSARHYNTYGIDMLYHYVDAIPMDDNDNQIYNFDLSEKDNGSYASDPLLWALPNVAVYNPADNTDYILNCNLVSGIEFRCNKHNSNSKIKGQMHYPFTVSKNGYSMLCLPGTVRKECMPEGSRLFICGTVNDKDGKLQSNIVECDTVPAGVPFIVKVPTETTDADGNIVSLVGKEFDVVMRGEIVDEPQQTLPTGATTGLHGTFITYDKAYPCVNINEDDGTLKVSYDKAVKSAAPFSGYFISQKDIFLIDYILLDETAKDIQDIINDNKGKTVNIKLKRALQPQKWNTVCLPFAMSDEEIQETFGEGTLVEQLTGVSNTDGVFTLTFSKKTGGIEAGKAYLIKPSNESLSAVLSFPNKLMGESEQPESDVLSITGGTGTLCLQGTYACTLLNGNDSNNGVYFTQDNKIYRVSVGSNIIMNGFRCYILTSEPTALSAARMVHNDGTTTDLRMVEIGSTSEGQRVYNIQGMQTDEQVESGVYIKGRRKYVKK